MATVFTSAPMFVVYFLKGGYTNFVCDKLNGMYSEALADKEVKELQKMGYPAMKMEAKKAKTLGGLSSYSEFCDFDTNVLDVKRAKEYFDYCKKHYLS